jgi:Kef-type K+ transport system membrane component KefB
VRLEGTRSEALVMDQIAPPVFTEVAALGALAAAVGFVGNLLRQPLIVGFIVVGLIAGLRRSIWCVPTTPVFPERQLDPYRVSIAAISSARAASA